MTGRQGSSDFDDTGRPTDNLRHRLQSAAEEMSSAADAHRPVEARSAADQEYPARVSGDRRGRALAVGAALLLIAGAFFGISRLVDDNSEDVSTDGMGACEDGSDLLVMEVSSEVQDPDLFDGFHSVAVTTSGTEGGDLTFLNAPRDVVTQPSLSPTGDQVAVVWADGDYESASPQSESIWVINRVTGSSRPLTIGPSDVSPAWSPDGTLIAYVFQNWEERTGEVRVIPAQGGEPRTLAPVDLRTPGVAWLPDGSGVVAWSSPDDPAGEEPGVEIVRILLDGSQETVAQLESSIQDATLIPGGEELLVSTTWPPTGDDRLVAVDLNTGQLRLITGLDGTARWSPDGARLYVVEHGPGGGLRRASYDGESIVAEGPIITVAPIIRQGQVGPCTESLADDHQTVDDKPLAGTDWRLGQRSLTVADGPATPDCQSPDCHRVHLKVEMPGMAPACAVFTGSLRGSELTVDPAPVDEADDCSPQQGGSEARWTPVGLDVDGDLLRLTLHLNETPEHPWTVTFGALYVGEAPDPVTVTTVDGPRLSPVDLTPTTVPVPVDATCAAIEAFGERLAQADTVHDLPEAANPSELADRSDLVVKGKLVSSSLGASELGGEMAMVYTLVVEETLVDRSDRGLLVGETVAVPVEFTFAGDNMPGLGDLSQVGHDDNQVPPGAGVPTIAFLDAGDAVLPDELRLAGASALVTGCADGPLGGLVGSAPAWEELADLDALADAVRD